MATHFWVTVSKTVCPVLSDCCLSCTVCDIGVLWPNSWMDQDETWHLGRPLPCPHSVRWESNSPSPKGAQPPIFGRYPLRPNGCIDQDDTWYGGRPRPRRPFVRWGPSFPSPKWSQSPLLNFWPMSVVTKRLDGSRWHLAWRWALVQATLC